jgi:hypothetical protein
MPIKDLSETVRLPRLGKIHLGTKNPEKGYPMKADHFVFPKDHSDYEKLVKTFGAEPKELRVLIPVEDEEQWATQYYKAYNLTRGLVCKGDGDTAMRQIDVKTGDLPSKETLTTTMKEMPCAGRDCPDYKAKKCHEAMNLRFILPEIPGLGVWQIDTGSINSILNINSSAKIIKKAFGRISMIPLILSFKPAKAKNPQDGKQQTIYVLNLETNITLAQLADVAREQAKTLMLEAPDLGKEYDLETERLTEELFGEDELVKAPPHVQTSTPSPDKVAGVSTDITYIIDGLKHTNWKPADFLASLRSNAQFIGLDFSKVKSATEALKLMNEDQLKTARGLVEERGALR